ncbi:MAG TPA: crossover junction endodeoxyribonuclease RuvC [Bacteroidia bacterium]|nr:crossover junction endodeoxyribonuclease RuvC [Bacteroidia bacterium]
MIILGIDPGTIRMGYAIIKVNQNKPQEVLSIGYIDLSDNDNHSEKLKCIYEEIFHLIEKYQPNEMAIESPFYGKNVQSMLKLGRAQGVAMAVAFSNNLMVTEYSPKKIKLSITGNGNASKEQVASMLKNMLLFDYSEKYLDATDALAVAVCHCFQKNNPIKNSSKKTSSKKQSWKSFIEKNPSKIIDKKS